MKTKVRKIVVDGTAFTWRIVRSSEAFVLLRVWRAEEPREVWREFRLANTDAWLSIGNEDRDADPPITPTAVAELIRAAAG